MSYFLVLWIGSKCSWWIPSLPQIAKQLVCESRVEYMTTPSRIEAHKKVRDLGGTHSRLFWCKGLKCHERGVKRSEVIEIE